MKRMTSSGGPTIMDINSGFVRDANGLVNLYDEKDKNMEKGLVAKGNVGGYYIYCNVCYSG
jgi:hypothetical protein